MTNSIDPTPEQFAAFKNLPRDTPIHMLNLVRLKKDATYEDDRGGSGADAYKAYGLASSPIFKKVGGKISWRGQPEAVVIGPTEEQWDIAFIASYPNSAAFMAMVKDPDYQAIVYHRQAGVEDSRLIRMAGLDSVEGFA